MDLGQEWDGVRCWLANNGFAAAAERLKQIAKTGTPEDVLRRLQAQAAQTAAFMSHRPAPFQGPPPPPARGFSLKKRLAKEREKRFRCGWDEASPFLTPKMLQAFTAARRQFQRAASFHSLR